MKRKILTYTGGLLLIGATALLTLSAVTPDFKIGKNLEILFNVFREVNSGYVDPIDPDKMMTSAVGAMLSDLDPYTEFLPESEMENFEIMTTGKYGGIGSLIRENGEWVEIAQPYKGFAADKAGLQIGDKILAIDGKDMKGADTPTVSNLMKGDPGTSFKIKIERFADGQVVEKSIKRERIAISGVSYYGMVADGVGYISHDNFTEDCSADIKKAIMELKSQGMQSLIFDLRGNGGGILQEAVKIVGMFVAKGTEVVAVKGKSAESQAVYRTTTDHIFDGKMVVLISSGSASAAEIVAGALQDVDRAVLMGQRSFGKGLVQSTRPVGYNSYIKLTTAKYYIPSGRCIQAIDYSNRNEDGSVGYVADSLIKEFSTKAGRKVYDGGGIMPDVKREPQLMSAFTINLYAKAFLDDYANEYARKTGFASVDVDKFALSDADYKAFVEYMKDKDIGFESETQLALDNLKKIAVREKYADRIAPELDAIREKIAENNEKDMMIFRDEISKLLEDNIVLRYHYSQGVIRHQLNKDKLVEQAVRLIDNTAEYDKILKTQDTQKK